MLRSHMPRGTAKTQKTSILLLYKPVITHLDIYPDELKNYIHTKTYTWIFITALLTVVKTWKPPRSPPGGEWINKLWYIQTMEYSGAVERNEPWKDVEETLMDITKRKKSIWKGYLYDSSYMTHWKKAKLWRQKIIRCQGLGWRERGISAAQRDFRAVNPLSMILWWWIHVIVYLSKSTDWTLM